MNDETTGWIKLHRSLCDNELWGKEPFTRGQAWVDMLLLANHEPSWFWVRGIQVNINRGQLGYSMKTLSQRWQWSDHKVKRFLNLLKNDEQIDYQITNETTVISILNYNLYQQTTSKTTSKRRANDEQTTTYKNDKNEKNINTNTKYSSLEKINSSDKDEIAKTYGVSLTTVEDEYENLKLYCESKGVSYKNYKAALINFIKRSKRNTSNNATLII